MYIILLYYFIIIITTKTLGFLRVSGPLNKIVFT